MQEKSGESRMNYESCGFIHKHILNKALAFFSVSFTMYVILDVYKILF